MAAAPLALAGVGFGSAFYLYFSLHSRNLETIVTISRLVVIADWCITTPAILIQPLTGWLLVRTLGYDFGVLWLQLSLLLYALAGFCWVPVVWLQIRMRDMAAAAQGSDIELPARFWHHARTWELLGYPAFAAMLVIYGLMVFRPSG